MLTSNPKQFTLAAKSNDKLRVDLREPEMTAQVDRMLRHEDRHGIRGWYEDWLAARFFRDSLQEVDRLLDWPSLQIPDKTCPRIA